MPINLSTLADAAKRVPAPVFEEIAFQAARRHPNDFATQKFVILNQSTAWAELDAAKDTLPARLEYHL